MKTKLFSIILAVTILIAGVFVVVTVYAGNDKEEKVLIDKAKKDMQSAKNTFEAYDSAYKRLQNDKAEFDKKVNEAANQKLKFAKNVESKFIIASGLADAYMTFVEQTQKEAEKESQKM